MELSASECGRILTDEQKLQLFDFMISKAAVRGYDETCKDGFLTVSSLYFEKAEGNEPSAEDALLLAFDYYNKDQQCQN